MPTVKLHYDGWVSLPSSIRQKLGLNSGDRLEADLVNGAIVLRPAVKASSLAPHDEEASNPPAAGVPETLTPQAATPARRKPGGRERVKLPTSSPPLPSRNARVAGRRRPLRRRLHLLTARWPEVSRGSCGKEDLQPKAASDDQPPLPSRPPHRAKTEAGYQLKERSPFRNVEVRKLGPGRRHNRPRGHP